MKKYLLVLLLLTGCSTVVPVAQKFPLAPEVLLEPCKPLKAAPDNATLSQLTKTVVENYTEYHQCTNIVAAWREWYTSQKQLFEELR
jgi:hypothetical protein